MKKNINFSRISFFILYLITALLLGCAHDSEPETDPVQELIELPKKGSKIAFIFPAGGGAMQVIVHVLAKMEKDLGVTKIGEIMHMAGGVSSGSITAALFSYDTPPRYSANYWSSNIQGLIDTVFPSINDLLKKLRAEFAFSSEELTTIMSHFASDNASIDLSNPTNTLIEVFKEAAKAEPMIIVKIFSKIGSTDVADIGPYITANFAPQIAALTAVDTALLLGTQVVTNFGNVDFSDNKTSKIVALAAKGTSGVVFGPANIRNAFSKFNFSVPSTTLPVALISSSAIPGVVTPQIADFYNIGGAGTQTINDLKDGVAAFGFDPSRALYEGFAEFFKDDELVIVYVGNGAPIDDPFRKELKFRKSNAAQTKRANGTKITFLAIDANIKDGDGKNAFSLAGFDSSDATAKFCKDAAHKATRSAGYKTALRVLKAAIAK